jgi:hypothetical protein
VPLLGNGCSLEPDGFGHPNHGIGYPVRFLLVTVPRLADCQLGLNDTNVQQALHGLIAKRILQPQKGILSTCWVGDRSVGFRSAD